MTPERRSELWHKQQVYGLEDAEVDELLAAVERLHAAMAAKTVTIGETGLTYTEASPSPADERARLRHILAPKEKP